MGPQNVVRYIQVVVSSGLTVLTLVYDTNVSNMLGKKRYHFQVQSNIEVYSSFVSFYINSVINKE